jgi:tRNA nucleotidyltransferase (CCA-adding enzyme)
MNEDALRILRGARFINILNQSIKTEKITQQPPCFFDIEPTTWKAMQKSFYLVRSLPKERLHQELMKVFSKNKPFEYIATIDELGLIPQLFPALERCKNILQPTRFHPLDVYYHSLMVLRALQERNASPLLKLAALYHDVGKVDQYHYHSLGIGKEEKGTKLTGHMYHTNI